MNMMEVLIEVRDLTDELYDTLVWCKENAPNKEIYQKLYTMLDRVNDLYEDVTSVANMVYGVEVESTSAKMREELRENGFDY